MFENINRKLENLSFSVKNQLSFNKMIETQIAQIATTIPINHSGKILGQPENSLEFVNAATDQSWTINVEPLPNVNQYLLKIKSKFLKFKN